MSRSPRRIDPLVVLIILLAIISLTGLIVTLTSCVSREPFPDGMSMETWLRIHHIEIKP